MKNSRTSLTARTFVVGAALALALSGAAAFGAHRAYALEGPTFAQEQVTCTWAVAGDAAEAAYVSGLRIFGVPPQIVIGGKTFNNPEYASSGKVAQARYEQDATMLVLRKTACDHMAPLTDHVQSDFAANWYQDVDGIDVELWGNHLGDATVITWSKFGCTYGVTYQGLGGGDVSMNEDEVATIVRAVQEANPARQASTQDTQTTPRQDQQNSQQQAPEQQAPQQQEEGQQGNTGGFSREACTANALASVGAGDCATGVSTSDRITGGGTDYYIVEFDLGQTHFRVMVDAFDGSIIDVTESVNGMALNYDEDGNVMNTTPLDE